MRYGLYDLQDHCWVGSNDEETGPKTFEDPQLAEVAREVVCRRLRWPYARVQVRPCEDTVFTKKDEVPAHMSTARALRKLEAGL